MPRSSAPRATSITASIAAIALIVVGCASSGAAAEPTSPATAAAAKPSFTLTVSPGPDGHVSAGDGTYRTDPATSLNVCTHASDGSWRYLYGGGDPFVNIDLLVGPRAGEAGGASQVAMELSAGKGNLRFDPTQLRGGDEPGRSTATIVVTTGPSTTTFDVTAVTPDKNDASDIAKVSVALSLTCPN